MDYTDLKTRLGMVHSDLQGRVDATKLQVISEALAAIEELEADLAATLWREQDANEKAMEHLRRAEVSDQSPETIIRKASRMNGIARDAQNRIAELKGGE